MTANIRSKNKRTSLNWSQLDAIISGVSTIDQTHLAIRNHEEAYRFVLEYGFDIKNPEEETKVRSAHREAIEFIENHFLERHQKDWIPHSVRQPENLLDLLVLASNYQKSGDTTQQWACAVLKVMHCIFHIEHDLKMKHFDAIRKQIFDSFEGNLEHIDGKLHLKAGHYRLPICHYIRKRNKGRNSVIMKLLQKPGNVASDIYDHLGMRLVFKTRIECLFALKLLRKNHLIGPTNVKPFRSRNTLIDLKKSKTVFSQYKQALERAEDYPRDILDLIDDELDPLEAEDYLSRNPHSSKSYNAIQITVRKMIKVPNPMFQHWEALRGLAEAFPNGEAERALKELNHAKPEKLIQFYFDYELQIMDLESFERTLTGPASHEAYKQRQLRTARRRALGRKLVSLLGDKNPGKWIDESLATALM